MTTDEEKKRIARHLLLSSPPGQFDIILSDLNTLLHPSSSLILSNDFITLIRSEYDSRCGGIVEESGGGDGSSSELQSFLKTHYIDKHLHSSRDGGIHARLQVVPTQNGYTITVYAERIHHVVKNHHAGSWTGCYQVVDDSQKSTMEGEVKIRAHTFEDGNFQLLSKTVFSPTPLPSFNTITNLGVAIVQQLERWDRENVLSPLHTMYETMSDGALKSLRRIMPMTRTKFDWNIGTHRLVRTLNTDVKTTEKE